MNYKSNILFLCQKSVHLVILALLRYHKANLRVFMQKKTTTTNNNDDKYSPTILKNILCLFLKDSMTLNVTQLLMG